MEGSLKIRRLPHGDKLVKSINSIPIMDSNNFEHKLFKKKLAHHYEYFNLDTFQEPLRLTKEDSWSTLKQTTPPEEEIHRTQKSIEKKYEERTRINYVIPQNGCSTIS